MASLLVGFPICFDAGFVVLRPIIVSVAGIGLTLRERTDPAPGRRLTRD